MKFSSLLYILSIIVALVFVASNVGCGIDGITPIETSEPTGGQIPPRKFRFVEVLPLESGEPGGWQIACVKVLVGQGVSHLHHVASRVCDIQVGVPKRTTRGDISKRKAQFTAADAANKAAYRVLTHSFGVDGATCKRIREEMQSLLRLKINSASVTKCGPVPGKGKSITAPPEYWPEPN